MDYKEWLKKNEEEEKRWRQEHSGSTNSNGASANNTTRPTESGTGSTGGVSSFEEWRKKNEEAEKSYKPMTAADWENRRNSVGATYESMAAANRKNTATQQKPSQTTQQQTQTKPTVTDAKTRQAEISRLQAEIEKREAGKRNLEKGMSAVSATERNARAAQTEQTLKALDADIAKYKSDMISLYEADYQERYVNAQSDAEKALIAAEWAKTKAEMGGELTYTDEKGQEVKLSGNEAVVATRNAYNDAVYNNALAVKNNADFEENSKPNVQGELLGNNKRIASNVREQRYNHINGFDTLLGNFQGDSNDFEKYDYMNEDERAVYNYIYNTQGVEAADDFLNKIDYVLVDRKAGEIEKKANTGIEKALLGINAGFADVGTAVEAFVNGPDVKQTAAQVAAGNIRQELEEGSGFGNWLTKAGMDLGRSTAFMVPSLAVGAFTGGIGAAATTLALSGANAYNQKIQEGYTEEQAKSYGVLVGASEATLQYLLGGISKLGGKYSVEALTPRIAGIQNGFGRFAASLGASAISEGAEEGLQEVIEPLFAVMALDEKYDAAELGDVAYAFLLGAASAGALEGVQIASNNVQMTKLGKGLQALDDASLNDLINKGLNSEKGSTAYIVAEKLQQQIANGQKPNAYQLGTLYAESQKLSAATQPEQTAPADPIEQAAREAVLNDAETLEDVARQVAAEEAENQTQSEEQSADVELPKSEEKPVETAENANEEAVAKNTTTRATQSIMDTLSAMGASPTATTLEDGTTEIKINAPSATEKADLSKFGENGKKYVETLSSIYDTAPVEDILSEVTTAYEAGRTGLPMDKVTFQSNLQKGAFNAGRMDNILDMGKKTASVTENSAAPVEISQNMEYTDSKEGTKTTNVKPLDSLSPNIARTLDKKRELISGKFNGTNYITDGLVVIPTGDIIGGEKVRISGDSLGKAINNQFNNSEKFTDITENPVETKINGIPAYVFTLADGNQVAIQKKYAKYFDGNTFSVGFAKGIPSVVKVSNPDGSLAGVIMPIRANNADGKSRYNFSETTPVSMKSFKIKKGRNGITAKEEAANGTETVGKVPDESGVLEPDVSRSSDGRLLDGLATENQQETESRGDTVRDTEEGRGDTSRPASRSDTSGDGRGRSLGDSERGDLQSASREISEDEEGALLAYKSSESYKINDALRNGTELSEYQKSVVSNLDSALKKLPAKKGTFYRNISFDYFGGEEAFNAFMEGAETGFMSFDGYTSTSTDQDGYPVEGEYVVHMVIEGQNGRDLEGFGANFESEVLFPRGMSVEVDRIEYGSDGKPTIYIREDVVSDGQSGNERTADGDSSREQNREPERDQVSRVQEVQEVDAEDENLQPVSEQNTRRDILGEEDLQGDAAEVTQKSDLATQSPDRGVNFTIPENGLQLPKGEKARFKANVEAIKTLKTLMAENRRATPAEQEILSKYVGWGGLANAFDEKKSDWAKEYKQLKELLTDKEYSSARGSTLNAHYTEIGVIRAMYAGLEKLGFKGGRVLEPSAGVGHFAGAMPSNLDTRWTMVELDEITGNIAKYLYPNADVRVQGFETTKIPDNYMDMAIGNVPFGNYAIADKSYPKAVTSAIHNYFFAKSLDKVREGGIVAFITSRFTMDAQSNDVREYIAKRADLLGAIRLPDTAFKGNAGTEVVTDILIFKKRKEGTPYGGEDFSRVGYHHSAQGIYEQTNTYFAQHPEMVLGTAEATGSMYRNNSLTYKALPGNLAKQIEKAFTKIEGKMDYPVQRTQEEIRAEIKQNAGKAKNGQIVKKDGKLYRSNDGVLVEADISKAQEEAVSDIITMRDTARELLNMQLDGASEEQIAKSRKALNSQYDAFVKKNGALNLQKNKRLVNLDVDAPFILALENYNKDTKTATKADIFKKNTVAAIKTVSSVNTVEEGLIVSVNETGGVNVDRIAELLGESKETVTRILLDNRLAFKNRDGKLETAEQYLSGNVKAKLKDAEALAEGDADYNANIEELKKIIPADIAAEDIAVQPGVTWIPDSVYSDFAAQTLGGRNSNYSKDVTVTYNKLLGTFSVTLHNGWLKNRIENNSTWGTPDRSFINILEATLNSKSVTVTRKLDDGSRVVDKQATAAAQEKQEKIRAEFLRWLWDDETRKETLAKLYNDINNNYVTPKYDGSNLTVNGSNPEKPLRPHQKNAVQRIINSGGNTLLAHKVGAGKTYEMAAAAMKLRELGIVKKPMFVVPKSLVAQWGNEFLDFFPAAKILVLGEKDFSAENRKLFANRIATGDYDAVILSQEQFKAVPMSAENQEAFYQEQVTALELAIRETAQTSGKRDPSIKQMEKSKKSFEAKIKKLGDMKKDTDNIDFEQLGIDAIFVDEAHSYKNLFYNTNMNNVSGLGNKEGSQKAFDLFMKVKYLQALNGGRGIVFATATPVMNSMSEMYIMQRYLQPDLLEARGLHSFDAWAKQFGEVRTVLEMNPSGKGFRQKQSFSRFKNLAELQQMFRAFADVLTDIPGLKIPTMKEGKRIIVESEPSEFQMDFIDKLAERADAIKGRKVDPKDDNMLKVTSEGRKLSYTQRMIDASLPYEPGNKIVKCAENVYNLWQESKGIKGTQLIFCDLSTPKGSANTETNTETNDEVEDISIYDDIRNMLIASGVPAKEIAFIHDANTNEKKAKLFADVNEGKVRVLIGSTGKMGVGMNAQKRIVALHHLDAPWRPGDIEQREGRALRQGNINEEVGMYVYVTKQTFDSRMWDNLQRKATFIHQIMAGDLTARESEGDGDFALSAAEIKAISSGNPLILEQFEVSADLARLENLERAHRKEVSEAKKRIEKAHLQIASDEVLAQHYREDIKRRQDTTGDKFKMTIGKKVYTERKAAGEALIAESKSHLKLSRETETVTEIGSFAGFKMFVTNGGDIILKGSSQYRISANMQSPGGTIQSLEAQPKRIEKLLEDTEGRLSENKRAIPKLEKTVNSPFDKADELESVRKRNSEILAELNPDDEANIAEMDGADEDGESETQYSRGERSAEKWTAERVGNTDKKPKPLSEIIEQIRHDFGINITKGHIRGKDVLGQYNTKNQGIRTKIANDLPNVAHELGHHIANIYGMIKDLPDNLKTELTNGLDEKVKKEYKESEWVSEGYAEFFRKFLQNHETAAIDYPEFTKHFKSTLSGSDLILIEQLADDVNAYYSLDADTATSAIRLSEEGAPDARTLGEKIKDKMSSIYQAWVDANHAIKRFDADTGSNAYIFASNAAYSDAMAAQIIIGDLTDSNGQYVAPGLKTALSGIDLNNKTEYKLFGEYLIVRHGPERLAEGQRIFADDRKNSTQFMEQRQAELEAQYPQFKEAAERLYDFQREFLHTHGVETGLVSETSYDEWGERWQYYVPFNRAVSEDSRRAGAKRGFANQNSTIKKARGSGLEIIHPVDNIVTNIVKMVNAGARNNVMRIMTDSAEKLGANAEWMEKVPAPLERHGFDMTGTKEDIIKMFEESDLKENAKEQAADIVNALDDILYQYSRGKAHGNVVTVLKNGKPEFWKINDAELLKSVTTLSPHKMEGILDAYAVTSRFMTANITGLNVVWSLFSNFPRDLMTFFTYSKVRNPLKVFSSMGSAYVNRVNNSLGKSIDPLYREYIAMGGGQQSVYTADRDLAKKARKKLSGKKSFGDYANPIEWLTFTSELIEMGPRFATYKMMRQQGLNPQEALYAATDITVNFRRGGKLAREMNNVFPFFNVSIQGLDKFRRWITADELKGKPERTKVIRGRTLGYVAVSGALAAMLYAINNSDEEDEKNYEQLSNYQKNSYWNIPTGDGKYFAIPKPRELGVLSSLMERTMEAGIGENEHAFDEFGDYASQNMLPKLASDVAQIFDKGLVETSMNVLGSAGIIGVFGYLGANRDFLGRPIVSEGLQALEPKDQYTNRTSKIAYWLGQAFNGSPAQIDFFFQQVLGGFWKGQKALLPVGGENIDLTLGVQNTYVKDNQYTTDLVNWMYDKAEKSEKAKSSNPGNMELAISAKMDSNMTSFYSKYYKLAKDKKETTATRATRQTVLNMILEYQKAADNNYTTDLQKAVYAIVEKQDTTELLPSVMQSVIKDASGKEHALSDIQYVEYQTDYNRLYWEYVEDNLGGAVTDVQKAAVLRYAKEAAREQATNRTLARIGAAQSNYFTRYGSADVDDVITYKANRYLANDDKSVTQDEVIKILDNMLDKGLTSNAAYDIYLAEYDTSGKLISGAKSAGIDAETFLEYKYNLNNLEYEKGVNGARKKAFTEMLDEMGLDQEAYDYLFGTEYKTDSKNDNGFGLDLDFDFDFGFKW